MPTDFSAVFKDSSASPAPTPASSATPQPKSTGRGQDIASVFQAESTKGSKIGDVISRAGKGTVLTGKSMLNDFVSDFNYHIDEIKKDNKADTGDLLGGWRMLLDVAGLAWSPVGTVLNRGAVHPAQQVIDRASQALQAHVDTVNSSYTAAERRAKSIAGEPIPKSSSSQLIKDSAEKAKTAVDAAVQALTFFIPGMEKAPEIKTARPIAEGRNALREIQNSIEPTPPPKMEQVSYALDSSMGFQKIKENATPELKAIASGQARSASSVLDTMLPHAEGYAKEFLTRLNSVVGPETQIRFRDNLPNKAGSYIVRDNMIEVAKDNPNMIHTVVHEMVHSATINAMDQIVEVGIKAEEQRLGRTLTESERLVSVANPKQGLLKELDDVIKEARIRAQKAGRQFYGLRKDYNVGGGTRQDTHTFAYKLMAPRYEFVAEMFSKPDFQEFLANSEKYASAGYKVKNLFNQMAEIIGKHLGFTAPQEAKLLHQAMGVGDRLLRIQEHGRPTTGKEIGDVIVARTPDGGQITRAEMKQASNLSSADLAADAKKMKNTLALSIEAIQRAVAPEALGERAKLAGATVASRIAEQMQKTAAWRNGSKTRLKFWQNRPELVPEFINRYEKGEAFSDPVLRDLSTRYREWNAKIAEGDAAHKIEYEPRDNYLYHVFEDSEDVSNYFTKKYGSKWGDPKFIKERAFDLYKEAIAAGFKPLFNNPEDIMLARQHASDIAEMHIGLLGDLEKYGLATGKVKGGVKLIKEFDKEGKASLKVEKIEGNSQPPETTRWRAPNGQIYWVDNQAHAVLENAFKSKSLWADKTALGAGFRGMMAVKNALIPIRLAISLFHPMHIIGIDAAAGMTRASVELLSGGDPFKSFKDFTTSAMLYKSLWTNPKSGWRVMQAWKGVIPKEALTGADAQALKTIVEGGLIPEMSLQYRTNARANFGSALRAARAEFRQGKVGKASVSTVKTMWHAPWALISAMSKPIFEDWIPALKTASYLQDAKRLLEANPELETNDAARQLALRKLAKSADNRYGEMAYNTLFWKRWIKDLAVLNTLSLGWQLGFIREYGGGAMDVGQFIKGEDKLSRIKKGELNRPIFVATYSALGAAVSGLMTYSMTSEFPSGLDWVAPRTGEKDDAGQDKRVSTMFYSREFASLYKHMENEGVVSGVKDLVVNKGSGLFGLMHEWATGVNSFGQEIRDPDGTPYEKLEQTLAYSLADLEPISMKAIQDNVTEQPVKSGALTVLGFTPAPRYLTESATTASIKQMFQKYVAPSETPFDKAQYSKEYSGLRKAYESGDPSYGDKLDSMSERFDLSAKDQRRIIKSLNSDVPPEVRMFMRLPWQQQKKVLDEATDEERDELLIHANKEHIRNSYEPPSK